MEGFNPNPDFFNPDTAGDYGPVDRRFDPDYFDPDKAETQGDTSGEYPGEPLHVSHEERLQLLAARHADAAQRRRMQRQGEDFIQDWWNSNGRYTAFEKMQLVTGQITPEELEKKLQAEGRL